MLETENDSRRLWPGTPSNVFFCASFNAAFALSSSAALALACASVMIGFGRTGLGGGVPSMRNDAARDMRGVIVGASVDATGMDSVRLWPGTFANIRFIASFEGGVRGPCSRKILGGVTPARRSAARVVRGTIVGETWERGISRALKGVVRWEVLLLLLLLLWVKEELPGGEWVVAAVVVVVVVVVVAVVVRGGWRLEETWEDERERREPVVSACPSAMEKSSGRTEVGKGGEETKRDAICISAVSTSGEPMTAFCSLLIP